MKEVTNRISNEYFSKLNKGYDKWFKKPFSSYVRKQQFNKFFEFVEGCEKYLEVGCGTGQFISKVACKERHGVDISNEMIEVCRERNPYAEFSVAPGHKLSFPDEAFDCVVMLNMFQYLENPEEVVNELYRVTKRGGRILFTVFARTSISLNPIRFFVRRSFGENLPIVNFYNQRDIIKMLSGKNYLIKGSGIRPPFESKILYQVFWKFVEQYENEHIIKPFFSTEMFVYVYK